MFEETEWRPHNGEYEVKIRYLKGDLDQKTQSIMIRDILTKEEFGPFWEPTDLLETVKSDETYRFKGGDV